MIRRSIVLLGGPDSGKTNYIGRLWPSFKKRKGVLRLIGCPTISPMSTQLWNT